jgi:hypothetical protein
MIIKDAEGLNYVKDYVTYFRARNLAGVSGNEDIVHAPFYALAKAIFELNEKLENLTRMLNRKNKKTGIIYD